MDAGELQFRTAALGGFQKQDVLDYIEKAGREHAERVEGLEKARDEALENAARLEEKLSGAEGERDALAGEKESLTGRLDAAEAENARLTDALAGARAERDALEEQVRALQARLSRAEPAAAAYESVKDRTAGIELEAHQRAMEVEAAAREQVKASRAEMEQWLSRVRDGYGKMRADLDAAVAHAAGELARVKSGLEGLTGAFDARDAELEKLIAASREALGPQAPKPLSLEEK